METVKQKIVQTSKTILFEEFNDQNNDNLATFLENNDPSDEMFVEELKKLEVYSFKDFLKKFAPDVYEICQMNEDGKPEFIYTVDAKNVKNQYAVKQPITEHTYYKMLSDLYYQKGNSNESNLQFDDTKILEMLTPKQEVEEAKDIRKSLRYNLERYQELKEKGENPSEYARQFVAARKKIVSKYKDSKMGLLPLVIDDTKTKLELINRKLPANDGDNSETSTKISGMLTFDEKGDLTVKSIEYKPEEADNGDADKNKQDIGGTITALIEQDYDATEKNKNDFVKSLVVSVYSPTDNALAPISNEELALKRQEYEYKIKQYEAIYKQAKQSFIDEMTTVLEKLLDVKIFFDHATADGGDEGRLEAGLIVSNCKANKLLSGNLVRERFEKFIKESGRNQDEKNKIWFAILPAVVNKDTSGEDEEVDDIFATISDDEDDTVEVSANKDYLDINVAKNMLKLLNESRIMTVFNFKADKDSGFGGITAKYIADTKEQLKDMDYDHVAIAYPNFTLTRERIVPLGNEEIKVPGVYIDASYPAVGLLVASQQINYLEKHGFKGRVNRNNVCVHVNLEDDDVRKNLTTKFNRELTLRWSKDITDEINRDDFGFVFSSDKIYINGEALKNTYVYLARTLKKNKDGIYIPIYQTLIKDFIQQYTKLMGNGGKIKETTLNTFLNKEVKNWRKEDDRQINCLLKPEEEIVKDEENNDSKGIVNLKIKFANDEMTVEINVGD